MTKPNLIHSFGFAWGPVEVWRATSSPRFGRVLLIRTPSHTLHIRITPTGRIRVGEITPIKKETT